MTNYCSKCGAKIDVNDKFCSKCGAEIEKSEDSINSNINEKESNSVNKIINRFKKRKKWQQCCIGLIIIFFIFILIISIFGGDHNNYSTDNTTKNTHISAEDVKANATTVDYKQLEKNPDKYKSKALKFSGKVLQIQEDNDGGAIRLATDGDYDDVIYVTYEGNNNVTEGDTITVYGICYGDYTYTSQANYKITLPWINAYVIN